MTTFRGLTSHDWCVPVEPFHLTTDDGPTSTARGWDSWDWHDETVAM